MPLLTPARVAAQGEMLGNRVLKRFRHLHPRMERAGYGGFRLYDRDIPEVRAVVDWYEGHLVVAEYARTQTDVVADWLGAMGRAVARALGVDEGRLHLRSKQARPTRGDQDPARIEVREGPLRFWVALGDGLDTGLGNDQRILRARVMAESASRRVLDLFGHAGTFTCAAARGGARATTTVELSGSKLDWTRDNLALNQVPAGAHALRREDAVWFLRDEAAAGRRYDLAVLDPPSHSARGGVDGLDLARDHRALVEATLAVLAEGGALYFCASHPTFAPRLDGLKAREITAETVPEDYRDRPPHRSWRIER